MGANNEKQEVRQDMCGASHYATLSGQHGNSTTVANAISAGHVTTSLSVQRLLLDWRVLVCASATSCIAAAAAVAMDSSQQNTLGQAQHSPVSVGSRLVLASVPAANFYYCCTVKSTATTLTSSFAGAAGGRVRPISVRAAAACCAGASGRLMSIIPSGPAEGDGGAAVRGEMQRTAM